jgi:hypothetical protein
MLVTVAGIVADAKLNGTRFDDEWEKYAERQHESGDTITLWELERNARILKQRNIGTGFTIADAVAEVEETFAEPGVWEALLALARAIPIGVRFPADECREI